jgi:hypothetical protein
MKENNKKINITTRDLILTLIFVIAAALLFYSSYFIDMSIKSNQTLEDTRKIAKQIADITISIDKISLNTDILKTGFLKNVTSLPEFPVNSEGSFMFGKGNPFLGGYISVSSSNGSSTGIRYTSQSASNSIIVVPSIR